MKYERFEDLPVWQAAIDLAKRVYDLTRDKFFSTGRSSQPDTPVFLVGVQQYRRRLRARLDR